MSIDIYKKALIYHLNVPCLRVYVNLISNMSIDV